MSVFRILIFDACGTERQQRLKTIIESNINCEVTEVQDIQRISQSVKSLKPGLVFHLVENSDIYKIAELPGLDAVPVISVIAADQTDIQDFDELPPQIADVIFSPFEEVEVVWKTKRLLSRVSRKEKLTAHKNILQQLGLKNIIGRAPAFLEVVRKIPLLADSDATILLTGETGVGKEVCARAIHYLSSRSDNAFMAVNCGAIPAGLVENELFGHKRGAFTDARYNQVGMITEAEDGTLFLDEIEALSLEAQSALLRLLQEKTYRPLGQTKQIKADLIFIAATNVDLKEQVKKGRFRLDLFYRFTIPLTVPPLRERKSDIPLLAKRIVQKYSQQSIKEQKSLSADAIQKLLQYDWPGNIRELENILQQAILYSPGAIIPVENINIPEPANDIQPEELSFTEAKKRIIEQFEKEYLIKLLNDCHGNITKAAKKARKDRRDLSRLIHKYKIDVNTFKRTDFK